MTQAEYFDSIVRMQHRLPDKDSWHTVGAVAAIMEPHPFNKSMWRITQIQFEDNSYYNVGQPDQGPRKDDDDDATH